MSKQLQGAAGVFASAIGSKTQSKQPAATAKVYQSLFGDLGARWCVEGKPLEQCAAEFIASQKARIAELESQNAKLTAKLKERK